MDFEVKQKKNICISTILKQKQGSLNPKSLRKERGHKLLENDSIWKEKIKKKKITSFKVPPQNCCLFFYKHTKTSFRHQEANYCFGGFNFHIHYTVQKGWWQINLWKYFHWKIFVLSRWISSGNVLFTSCFPPQDWSWCRNFICFLENMKVSLGKSSKSLKPKQIPFLSFLLFLCTTTYVSCYLFTASKTDFVYFTTGDFPLWALPGIMRCLIVTA